MIIAGRNVKLDWLSFTLDLTDENINKILHAFDAGRPKENGFGGMGYTDSFFILGTGRILWNYQRPEMGLHVILPSTVLALTGFTAMGLLNRVFSWDGKITRLDIAFDDFDRILNIEEMFEKLLAGEVVTRFRMVKRILGHKIGEAEKMGDTINIGSRSSRSFIRVYDKALEQRSKNVTLPDGVSDWVRVELELKSDKADAFALRLIKANFEGANEPGELCARLLLGLLDFKDVSLNDGNKSRWATASWWSDFCAANSKLFLSLPKKTKELNDTRIWLRGQVATSLAMVMVAYSDDGGVSGFDFIMKCVIDGEKKINKEQQGRIDRWNERMKPDRETVI